MRSIEFVPAAFNEYQEWIRTDKKIALKIGELIRDIQRNPYSGLGKPEPLKHELSKNWSRRIDDKHRLVYMVTEKLITIFSCYSHYGSK